MDNDKVKNTVKKLFETKEGKDFKKYFSEYTLFDIIGLFRYEDANTNFLAAFFDGNKNIFGLKYTPLLKFIEILNNKDSDKIEQYFKNLNDENIKDKKVTIYTRNFQLKGLNPDLVITIEDNKDKENNSLILLEAKLESAESSKDQCSDYYDAVEREYKEEYPNRAYVYLSLSNKDKISSDEYIKITYQDLIDKLYESDEVRNKITEQGENFLNQYLKSFSYLVKNGYLSDVLKMPVPKRYMMLAQDLYNKSKINELINIDDRELLNNDNNILFKLLLIILYNSKFISKEVKKKIKELFIKDGFIMEIINKDGNNEEIKTYGKIVHKIVKMLLSEGKKEKYINSIAFVDSKFKIIFSQSDFSNQDFTKNQKNWYKELEFNKEKYMVLYSYFYDEIQSFIDGLKENNIKLNVVIRRKLDEKIVFDGRKNRR